jgi:hypothetical protein
MTGQEISIISSAAGIIVTVGGSLLKIGQWVGGVKKELENLTKGAGGAQKAIVGMQTACQATTTKQAGVIGGLGARVNNLESFRGFMERFLASGRCRDCLARELHDCPEGNTSQEKGAEGPPPEGSQPPP